MTDKEKIRAEIERRYKECKGATPATEYQELLDFIDSMQEEPTIPEIVDEHWLEMLGEEPASSYKPDAFEMALTEMIDKARKCVIEPWVVAAQWKDELLSLAKGEESVSKKQFAFKAIPRLLDMIEPTDRAKAYASKLAEALEKEGYTTDAKIVRESIKIMNSEKVAMATMDEEPISEDFDSWYEKEWVPFGHSSYTTKNKLEEAFKAGAKWQKEQFEKNRLKHCDSITNEQAELESIFIDQHLNKYNRMPTFLDAIEYGMRLQKEQMKKNTIRGIAHLLVDRSPYEIVIKAEEIQNLKHGTLVKFIIIK